LASWTIEYQPKQHSGGKEFITPKSLEDQVEFGVAPFAPNLFAIQSSISLLECSEFRGIEVRIRRYV
jgi:hypothetical protein